MVKNDKPTVVQGTLGDGTTRRRVLTTLGAVGTTTLAGCNALTGDGDDGGDGGDSGDGGDGRSTETQYWNDWPIDTKNNDNVPLEYAAVEGQQLDPVRISFGNDDTPWMREHALMIQTSFEELNAPTELESVPVNVLYDEHWPVDTGHIDPVTMNVHGSSPRCGSGPWTFIVTGSMWPVSTGQCSS